MISRNRLQIQSHANVHTHASFHHSFFSHLHEPDVEKVRLLEGVMEAQEKHVDSLTDQLDEANKKLEQCESTIQQLSRSGDLTALALADEKVSKRHAGSAGNRGHACRRARAE